MVDCEIVDSELEKLESEYSIRDYFFGVMLVPDPEFTEKRVEHYDGFDITYTQNKKLMVKTYCSLHPAPLFNMGCEGVFHLISTAYSYAKWQAEEFGIKLDSKFEEV